MIRRDILTPDSTDWQAFDWFNDALDTWRWLHTMEVEHGREEAGAVRMEMITEAPASWARVLRAKSAAILVRPGQLWRWRDDAKLRVDPLPEVFEVDEVDRIHGRIYWSRGGHSGSFGIDDLHDLAHLA